MSRLRAYPIPNMVQGISQQAPAQRRDSQCEEQINCVNSPVFGASARPGTAWGAFYKGENFEDALIWDVVRTPEEQYRVIITEGSVKVYDLLTGSAGTVNVIGGSTVLEYLDITTPNGKPKDLFRAVTVEDTTFIVNREIAVAMNNAPYVPPYYNADPDDDVHEGFVHVKGGDYHQWYQVIVEWGSTTKTFQVLTKPGSDAANQASVRANIIADSLFTLMTGGTPTDMASYSGSYNLASDGFTVTRVNNLIRLRRTNDDGGDFSIRGYDGSNGDRMSLIKGPVSRYAQLPATMFNQAILSVRPGADKDEGDNQYWVEFEGEGFAGSYIETFKPGAKTQLNAATMPLLLVSKGNNQFDLKRAEWSSRVAGDGVKTAKDPSFVGRPIEDITLWRDRLLIMTESSVSLSKVSQYYTYFPDTVQAALDSDPIDFRAVHRHVAILRHAIAHGGQLFLWANKVQFGLESKEALSQSTIEATPTTKFDYDTKIAPITTGDNIVFTAQVGPWASIREQFVAQQGVGKDFADITSHVPGYIPAPLRWFIGDDTLCMYACNSEDEKNAIYVYQYLIQGEEKAQSAWNKWVFPAPYNIIFAAFHNGLLRLCIQRPEGVSFETLDLSAYLRDQNADYNTRLDRKTSEANCVFEFIDEINGGGETGSTKITLPWRFSTGDTLDSIVVITREGGSVIAGTEYEVTAAGNTDDVDPQAYIIVRGRLDEGADTPVGEFGYEGVKLWVGHRVSAEMELSEFVPKDDKGPFEFERVQVNAYILSLSDTGFTKARITYHTGTVRELTFSGRVLGSPTNQIGVVSLHTGKVRIPVKTEAGRFRIRLINDSPLPSNWQALNVHWKPTVRAPRA